MFCYQCQKPVNYIFADGRCKKCTRLTVEEVIGTEKPNPFPDDVDEEFDEIEKEYWRQVDLKAGRSY